MNKPESSEMVLVPREPTPEMLDALARGCGCIFSAKDGYRAMLAAAPAAHPSAAPQGAQPAEPVAWRFRFHTDDSLAGKPNVRRWVLTDKSVKAFDGIEVQPLYAFPQAVLPEQPIAEQPQSLESYPTSDSGGEDLLSALRESLYRAAISCPHEIDAQQIILMFDSRQKGHNALAQLADRLSAACEAVSGAVPSDKKYLPSSAAPAGQEDARDAKRMDWLDARRDTLINCFMQDGNITYLLREHWGAPVAHGSSVRAAVDAAMSATTKEN